MKLCVYLLLIIVFHTKCSALKPVHLAIVVCGSRLDEAVTSLKSSLIFTPGPVIFHIFTEDHLRKEFYEKIEVEWPVEYQSKFQMEFYPIEFTRGNDERWRMLFKPCCTQRLFIPDILKNIDSVIYVDTDTLFLSNVRNLWRFFRKFNSTQLAALSPEHEDPSMGWYNRFARHPYYGSMGLNSGVMLMNLTRMRQADMISKIMNIFDEFRLNITWGDQCLLNIYFNYHPEQLYEFTCDWNYRPDHCIYENNCAMAKKDGVKILHGCRGAFHNEKYDEFKAIYQVIQNWKFDVNLKSSLLSQIKSNLERFSTTNCGKSREIFTKYLSKEISSIDYSLKKAFHIAFIFRNNWNSIEQAYITLKSLSFFSSNRTQFHVHVVSTDPNIQHHFSQQIETMGYLITYYNTTIEHPFHLSKILSVDRVVYLNPNIIFTNSFEKLWSVFDNFNSQQIIGMFGQCHISGIEFLSNSSDFIFFFLSISILNYLIFEYASTPFKSNETFDYRFRWYQPDNYRTEEQYFFNNLENVYFIPCGLMLDPDHCQSIQNGLFLSDLMDHRLFRILYKLINQIDMKNSNELIENEINGRTDLQCRNELVKLLITNKRN
ncbi:unnamed protein product [Adineta ricciae]|uniref:UDP-D-xylose:beta-D-glucoside alpha-1,3-D-xylosyltransferase n=1 Tax=Adineta ricciae TaxID=249248 RepID=A0A814N243_ADIRI|nr:unnamed protein product [Adineta ricciae]